MSIVGTAAAAAAAAPLRSVATFTRRVSAQAGVTTGAIYRRYEGKGALLADVLLVALAPDRYEWTWELVAALASDDPYRAAADVMTAQLLAASRTEAEQRVDGGGRQAWSIFTLTLRPRIVQ
jgi:AcrR family transcriptional regulator